METILPPPLITDASGNGQPFKGPESGCSVVLYPQKALANPKCHSNNHVSVPESQGAAGGSAAPRKRAGVWESP